jgi:polyisoprenoid-binding protein YceI
MEIRLPLASFTADRPLVAGPRTSYEIVFAGAAKKPGKDGTLHLKGTLSFHGARRTVEFPVTLVRTGGMVFGHTSVSVHLRDFGLALPQDANDEARVTIDAGLRPEGALASSG